ncbi:MAG: BspA family leucine-rich repeat surface protein [Spirochaetes bacterium]|nr:BspA family leucine-rich repeat surface protein [Spirochaetota bacterium]
MKLHLFLTLIYRSIVFSGLSLFIFGLTSCPAPSRVGESIKQITISFDKNGEDAVGTMSRQILTAGTTTVLPACTFTRDGWTFLGWTTTPYGTVEYVDQDNLTMGRSHITLYAQWESPAFIMLWKTDNPGISADNQITLPLVSGWPYHCTVDWGDGTDSEITSSSDPDKTHTYSDPGIYKVAITGVLNSWAFDDAGDEEKLLEIQNWGAFRFQSTAGGHFSGCANLIITAPDIPNLEAPTTRVKHLTNAFRKCSSLTTIPRINEWDTSQMTSMQGMFSNATNFNQDLSNWNTAAVEEMAIMFAGARRFNGDISSWDTSNVFNMSGMFNYATSFNSDISGWDTSLVYSFNFMFEGAENFNQDISNWDTSDVTQMYQTFSDAKNFNQDLSSWDTSQVTLMYRMFYKAEKFNQNLSNWNVTQVTDMGSMFEYVTLSTTNYDALLMGWSAQSVESGVAFHGGNSQYSAAAAAARQALLDKGWTITDGGETP